MYKLGVVAGQNTSSFNSHIFLFRSFTPSELCLMLQHMHDIYRPCCFSTGLDTEQLNGSYKR
jgi:hypothetical protein